MIQASELRIGNYLEKSLKSGQGRKLICKIGCQDIVRISENTGSFNYEPIQLTEEILLKCGFKWRDNDGNSGNFKIYYNHAFTYNTNHGWWYFLNKLPFQIEYLYQLQNLYFALTNTELEINL